MLQCSYCTLFTSRVLAEKFNINISWASSVSQALQTFSESSLAPRVTLSTLDPAVDPCHQFNHILVSTGQGRVLLLLQNL